MNQVAARTVDLGLAALAAAQLAAAALLGGRGDAITVPGGGALGTLCPSRLLAGVDCPLCGMTRSFVALAHGRPGAALDYHPAGPALMVAMLVFTGAVVIAALRGAPPLLTRPRAVRAIDAVVAACLAAGVVHMTRS